MGPEDLRTERGLGGAPRPIGESELQFRPPTPHDRFVEGDQGFRDAIRGPPAPEDVGLADNKGSVLEHVQPMREFVGFASDVVRDGAVGCVTRCDGREH